MNSLLNVDEIDVLCLTTRLDLPVHASTGIYIVGAQYRSVSEVGKRVDTHVDTRVDNKYVNQYYTENSNTGSQHKQRQTITTDIGSMLNESKQVTGIY